MSPEATGVRVGQSPTRCPYCHDLVAPDAAFLACAGCLARHHAGCWSELGRCGACGETRPLVPAGDAAPSGLTAASPPREKTAGKEKAAGTAKDSPPAPRSPSRVALVMAVLASLLLAATVAFFLVRAKQEALERARVETEERQRAEAEARARAAAETAKAPPSAKARPAPATPIAVPRGDRLMLSGGEVVSAIGPWDPASFKVWWSSSSAPANFFGGDAEEERKLVLVDAKTDKALERLSPEPEALSAVALGPGDLAIAQLADRRLVRWSLSRHAEHDLVCKNVQTLALALLPDGTGVVDGSGGNQVTVCDLGTGQQYPWREIRSHQREVVAVAAAPDSHHYASASLDGTVKVWRSGPHLSKEAEVATLVSDAPSPSALAYLPDGKSLVVVYGDATLSVWDIASARETRVVAERRGLHVTALAALPDGDTLVLACDDRTIRTFSLSKAAELDRIALASTMGPGIALGVQPDGTTLRIATRSGLVVGLRLVTRDEYDGKKPK